VKSGLEVHPEDPATLVFLSGQDVCNEMVPVKESAVSEYVQDLKDRGAVI